MRDTCSHHTTPHLSIVLEDEEGDVWMWGFLTDKESVEVWIRN